MCAVNLPSVPRLADSHAHTQLLVRQIAEDLHPDLALYHVGFPIFQRQSVWRRADGRGPDDVPLHLHTLGWRARGHWPVGWGAPVEAQGGDLTGVEVAQLPRGPVHLFSLEVGPLIPEVAAVAEQPLGFFVFRLRLYLEGLAVLVGQAVLRLLDFLVQCFAQFSAQLPVGQAALAASFGTRTFLLRLASALAAGPGLRGAAVRLVAVSNRRFNAGIQKFILGVPVIAFVFSIPKTTLPLYTAPEVRLSPLFVVLLVHILILLFCLDLVQKFGKIRIVWLFLDEKNTE